MGDDRKKLDWKPALVIFSRVSAWVVGPIIFALILGKALDKHYGTYPLIFLSLTAMAFLFSSYGIMRVVARYIKDTEKKDQK